MTATEDRMGEIITFYSYKGGTGRSMALVNVACRLASIQSSIEGKGVLMIDWDLEAPGLHTFFRKRFEKLFAPNKNYEAELKLKPGLIDLFIKLDKAAYSNDEAQTEEIANILIEESQPENFILATDINSLHLLKAGRFDGDYKRRVNRFQWVALYNRSPLLISAFARYLSQRYRYILIDSRTGITDIAGICTTLMPEKLVTVFTPNRQSLEGLDELVRQATKYRRQSDDLRPLAVFPLASRIEQREPELGKWWRFGAADQDIPGYQPLFQDLFKEVYDLSDCDLGDYFKEVQVQHVAYYSYGENIAVLSETQPDRLSLPASYDTFVKELIDRPVPWKYQELSEIQSITNELSKRAEEAYALLSLDNQEVARRILTRLVRLTEVGEGGEDHSLRIPIRELDPEEILVAEVLAKARLILTNDGYVELAEEGLVREWRRLGNWIRADRDFLLWRQSLRSDIARWSDSKEHPSTLLTGNSLERAKRKLRERKSYLNDQERSYITLSETFETRQREKKVIKVIAALLLVCVIGVGLYLGIQKLRQSSKSTADVYLSLANTLLERKEYDEAIKNYDQAIKLDHNLPKAYYYRGLAYDQKGDAAMAEASYKEAIERRPDFPEPYKALGLLYFRKRDYDRAIDNLKRVVDLEPQNAEAYSNLAKAYLESNDATQAATYYKSAIQTMPDFAEAHVGLGDALARLNNFDQAIESFTKAITINSRLAEAYYHRGQAYEAKEQNSAALADYDLSLELKPNFADAYLKRADFYFKRWADQKDRNGIEIGVTHTRH